jgi:hypothetical protein
MKTWNLAVLLCFCAALGAVDAHSAESRVLTLEKGAKRGRGSIQDVAWMTGHWTGEALGGTAEEWWSPPMGDSMLGAFRVVKNGRVMFSELMSITEENGTLVFRVKHFDRDLKGREEKGDFVEFPFIRVEGRAAFFDGITYRQENAGALSAWVRVQSGKGEAQELAFAYRRFDPGAAAKQK